MKGLPLEGIRVIDAGEVLAGAHGATLLADMGAEVIKIEAIQRYQSVRGGIGGMNGYADNDPGEHPWNRYAGHNDINRNKMDITLNLNDPRGIKLFKSLVAVSDIVIENFRTGVMAKFGLDYPDLTKVNPQIIVVSLPGFGRTGPYATYASMGTSNDGASGHTALRGYIGDDASKASGIVHVDGIAALNGAVAAIIALYYRLRTGKGQHVDVAQVEAMMPHLADAILDYTMNGRVQQPMGNRLMGYAPHGCYPCEGEDQWVTIAVTNDAEWDALIRLMGEPEWIKDRKFSDSLNRWKNQDEIDRYVGQWTREYEKNEIAEILQKAGIAAGPVMNPKDLYEDPHLRERGFFETVTHREAGTHPYPGLAWKMSKTPGHVWKPGPCLGEHNEYILGDILGVTRDELAELENDQVIGYAPLPGSELSTEDRIALAGSAQ